MQSYGNWVTLVEALRSHARRNPQKIACACGDHKITYEELDDASTRLAARLLGQGLKPGDRLAIHWPNAIETVQLFFAAFKAGLIAVPVNLRLKTADRVRSEAFRRYFVLQPPGPVGRSPTGGRRLRLPTENVPTR